MAFNRSAYLPRIVDTTVDEHLRAFGAVEICGAMWSGKTWTAEAHGASVVSLDDKRARQLAEIDPEALLAGDAPHVIDEWQRAPEVWDLVRAAVDDADGQRGMFILTGSSRPARGMTSHSGAGRISTVRMWPMSLSESGASSCKVSLSELFEGKFAPGACSTSLAELARLICRGGWPGAIGLGDAEARLVPRQYVEALVSGRPEGAPGEPRELRAFLKSIARNIGGAATLKTIAEDMGVDARDKDAIDRGTRRARALLDHFIDRYVIVDLEGWDAPVKSKSRLRTSPRHCFADPSLPAALLGAGPQSLMEDMQLFGQLFEEMCLRDLRVYAQALPGASPDALRYYRDADGLEADAVIELEDGRWCAIEVKLGERKAEDAFRNLRRLREKVGANPLARNRKPEFMMVLVGKSDFRYRTEDGIFVVPVTDLTA